jgi:Ser/Thr protein kinase RdoA (MazF antagonist)
MKDIIDQFLYEGTYVSHETYGYGHINETYLVTCENPNKQYILQWINPAVFKRIPELMKNIELVTNHIKHQYESEGLDPKERVLTYVPTKEGESFFKVGDDYYRLYHFVENSTSYEQVPDQRYLELAGEAFGEFQKRLNTFDANLLFETIEDFHHTPKRYERFIESLNDAIPERLAEAKEWINFISERSRDMQKVIQGINASQIPLRVTHNDTKINNILFDRHEPKVKCLVDLDTVMPGSLLYDFGDAVRFGCSTAKEDETDLSLVDVNLDYFEAFTKGFMRPLKNTMTPTEFDYLAWSSILITLELGMRFLMDYLLGDHYFKIHREKHNFERAKNQLTLVKRLEEKLALMNNIVDKYR